MDDENKLQNVKVDVFADVGYNDADEDTDMAKYWLQNCYQSQNWEVNCFDVLTNTPINTYCRAPSSTQVSTKLSDLWSQVIKGLTSRGMRVVKL